MDDLTLIIHWHIVTLQKVTNHSRTIQQIGAAMRKKNLGDRYPLLLYRHLISRYRLPSLFLAVFLLGTAALQHQGIITMPRDDSFGWLFSGGVVALAIWLMTRIAPMFSYVQPRADHLRIQTPIYRLKISYRRIHGTRPVEIGKVFFRGTPKRRELKSLQPFLGETALMLDLIGWPLSPFAMRIFLHRYMLSPEQPGLVLIVNEWMTLSKQLSSFIDRYQGSRRTKTRGPGVGASEILQDYQEDWE